MIDLAAVRSAASARLQSVWGQARVYDPGAVPQSPATPYVVLSVDSGLPQNYRRSGELGTVRLTLVVQLVARTLTGMYEVIGAADAAFLDHSLTVAGLDCGPATRQPSTIRRDPDADGLLYALALFTLTAVPQED